MRLMITRPRDDAAPLAEALAARGHSVFMAPLLDILTVDGAAPDLDGVQGLLVTSANGVRAFAAKSDRRDLPVWAVGDASARAALEAGFKQVESAQGDVETLAALVKKRVDPAKGHLLHVAGSKLAGDLAGDLKAAGYHYRRAVLYTAETPRRLDRDAAVALRGGKVDGVLFFSPRTIETFVTLVRKGRLTKAIGGVTAYCLSPAVADRAAALKWRDIRVADRPEQDSLIECLEAARATGGEEKRQDGSMAAKSQTPPARGKGESKPAATAKKKSASTRPEPSADAQTGAKSAPTPNVKQDDKAGQTPPKQPPAPENAKPATGATTETVAKTTAKTSAKTERSGAGLLAAVIVAGIAVAGGAATFDLWYPRLAENLPQSFRPDSPKPEGVSSNAVAPDFAALREERERMRQQIDALLTRVGELESEVKETRKVAAVLSPRSGEAVAALSDRVSRLEGGSGGVAADSAALRALSERIASLEEGGTRSTQQADQTLNEIRERLKELEQESGVSGRQSGASAFVIAVGQLRAAVTTARPFASELAAIKSLSDAPEVAIPVAALEPLAAHGMPSLSSLQVEFDGISGAIIRASVTPDGDGWWQRTIQRLSSVVSVRRTGDNLSGDGVDAVVARTAAALERGDLAEAIAAISTLEGGPADVAAAWRAKAES
ncbi:MAG: uroporphyrinogen-III synthase, partial [Rhodospirillales bacterium]|nr:uroporphyrinogen-III synthase [Rhodospirillales bacterium]